MPESYNGYDLIQISCPDNKCSSDQLIYIPQSDELLDVKYQNLWAISKDGLNYFTIRWADDNIHIIYSINNFDLNFIEEFETSIVASFSPNSKYLALSVRPSADTDKLDSSRRFSEIWIIDVDKFLAERPDTVSVNIINLREKFCMYSFHGIDAEFITDNTLAVSMHKDGDDISYLWEITIDGKIVRQLTFEP